MVKGLFSRSLFFIGLFFVALSYGLILFESMVSIQLFIYGVGMFFLILGGINYSIVGKGFKHIRRPAKWLFVIIILWNCFIILNGFHWDYNNARKMFTDEYTFWPYLIVFLMPFGSNLRFIQKLFRTLRYFKYIWLFSLPYFFMHLDLFSQAQDFFWAFGYGAGVLLVLGDEKKNEKLLSLISIISALVLFLLLARRSMVVTTFYLLLFYFIKTFSSKKGNFKVVSFCIAGSIFFLISYFLIFNSGYFGHFTSRVTDNNRETVYYYFFKDMTRGGWEWWGKGMFGTYYSPLGSINTSPDRSTVETGYLQLILKGGYIKLILMVVLLISSIRIALSKSRNNFVKYSGILLIGWLLDMAAFGLPAGNLMYIFLWLYIGIINSSIRDLPDNLIKTNFKHNHESVVVNKYRLPG